MYSFQILSLLSLSLFINKSFGQTDNQPSQDPTAAPTISCNSNNCKTYIASNAEWLLPSNEGCKDEVNGVTICVGCPNENGQCECVSKDTDVICAFVDAVANAFATGIIILIVIVSLCGLCIIGSIIYCICTGALCCAASK